MTDALRERLFERRHSVTNWPGFTWRRPVIGYHFDEVTGKREQHHKSTHRSRIACIWRKHLRARGFWLVRQIPTITIRCDGVAVAMLEHGKVKLL